MLIKGFCTASTPCINQTGPSNDRAGLYIGRCSFRHNSQPAAAREIFKTSTDSARLVVTTEKKIQIWIWGSLGGTSQVGVF